MAAESQQVIFKELENSFKMLSDGDKRWEELLKVTEKAVQTYNYLYDQLLHTLRFQLDSEIIEKFPYLKTSIISTVSEKISEEIDILDGTRSECKKILESLQTKVEKIISLSSSLDEPHERVSVGLSALQEGRICLLASHPLFSGVEIFYGVTTVPFLPKGSYLKMSAALCEAKSLEVEIPKASFAYHPAQRQTVQGCMTKWRFYSTN